VCRVVASDSTTKRQLARCRTVVLSLTNHAKRRIVVRRVVAMLHCRSAQIKGLSLCIYISQVTGRKRAVWRASLTTGRQDDIATTSRLVRSANYKTKRR
jgi:hypothetical protein